VGIRGRIKRLELERERARPCPECGIRPGEVPLFEVEVEVVSGPVADTSPKHCGVCGAWLIVYWPEVWAPRAPDHRRASYTEGGGASYERL
jgi:hypothetical protein